MAHSVEDLLSLMRRLRDPVGGCPWDREQTFSTLTKHTVEEAYEVADVIERDALNELPAELGDLLFQVVFYAQLGAEQRRFHFADVVEAIHSKLVRRHPHVFAAANLGTAHDQAKAWEALKAAERAAESDHPPSEMDAIPRALPALSRAAKLQKRAARVGFDWPDAMPVFDKVLEEIGELRAAVRERQSRAAQLAELGDLLFAVVNLGRHLGLDPEEAVRHANRKFERRFRYIEDRLRGHGRCMTDADLPELDALWDEAKRMGL